MYAQLAAIFFGHLQHHLVTAMVAWHASVHLWGLQPVHPLEGCGSNAVPGSCYDVIYSSPVDPSHCSSTSVIGTCKAIRTGGHGSCEAEGTWGGMALVKPEGTWGGGMALVKPEGHGHGSCEAGRTGAWFLLNQ